MVAATAGRRSSSIRIPPVPTPLKSSPRKVNRSFPSPPLRFKPRLLVTGFVKVHSSRPPPPIIWVIAGRWKVAKLPPPASIVEDRLLSRPRVGIGISVKSRMVAALFAAIPVRLTPPNPKRKLMRLFPEAPPEIASAPPVIKTRLDPEPKVTVSLSLPGRISKTPPPCTVIVSFPSPPMIVLSMLACPEPRIIVSLPAPPSIKTGMPFRPEASKVSLPSPP